MVFAYSSILSWSLYGRRCVEFLTGSGRLTPVFYAVFLGCTAAGSLLRSETAWRLADIANLLLSVPNLIGLFALSGTVFTLTRDYFRGAQQQSGSTSARAAAHNPSRRPSGRRPVL